MDLHVHTWASKDFESEGRSPHQIAKAIVEKSIEMGLGGIAITDHMTGDAIDDIRKAAKRTDLAIFPGVEISAPGGKRGPFHVVGLFPTHCGSDFITKLLGNLQMRDDKGTEGAYADLTVGEVVERIHDNGGLPLLPHPDSSSGYVAESRGRARADVLAGQHLKGVERSEWVEEHYPDVAQYHASDSHSVSAVGQQCSLFKVAEPSFEALRQCFEDPDVRIRIDPQEPSSAYPYIESIRVSGGFLDGLELQLHRGLNALLGGKGVGKSLVIEFLRFALHRGLDPAQGALKPVHADHQGKLQNCLGLGGKVEVVLHSPSGARYSVCRTYDGQTNPTHVVDLESSEEVQVDVASLMPTVVFSQREIALTVEDTDAQMRWLDQSLKIARETFLDEELLGPLRQSDEAIARALLAEAQIAEREPSIAARAEELKQIRTRVASPIALEMDAVQKTKAVLGDVRGYHQKIKDQLVRAREEVGALAAPSIGDARGLEADARLNLAVALAHGTARRIVDQLQRLIGYNDLIADEQVVLEEAFGERMSDVRQRYADAMGELDTDMAKLHARRVQLEDQLAREKRAMADQEKAARMLPGLLDARRRLLNAVQEGKSRLSQARHARFAELNASCSGRIEVELRTEANREGYAEALAGLRTRLRRSTIEGLVQKVSVRRFLDLVIRRRADQLAKEAGINDQAAARLIAAIMDDERVHLTEVLSWQYLLHPEDEPVVQYHCSDEGKLKPLAQLSVGQKSSALTVLALAEGDAPVVMDQPEDSLDIRAVWEDIVQAVRGDKERRQFIFTTHNSTVAVAADADTFAILSADADGGHLDRVGAIEVETVRPSVIQHLEGGTKPYKLKRAKYGRDVD